MPKIGLHFPSRDIAGTRAALRTWMAIANEAGVDYINMSDHILGVDPAQQARGWDREWMLPTAILTPYNHQDRWHEPMVTMGFLAALGDMAFLTSVLVLTQRNTALVAKQAAQVDILCDGRLRLGVGIGWNAAEFASVGADFGSRGTRFREQVALLRRLWTEDVVTFEGEFHNVRGAGIAPRPVQQPIPIWIGGANVAKGVEPVAGRLRRIGEIGDGWVPDTATEPDERIRDAMQLIRTSATEHGRDAAAIGLDARLNVRVLGRDNVAVHAAAWTALGATHLNIDAAGLASTGTADYAQIVRELVRTVRESSMK